MALQNAFEDLATEATLQGILSESISYAYWASGSDDNYDYIAKENKYGGWYIMRVHKINGTAQYVKGLSDIATAWTNKSTQTYVSYSETF